MLRRLKARITLSGWNNPGGNSRLLARLSYGIRTVYSHMGTLAPLPEPGLKFATVINLDSRWRRCRAPAIND